ncbi:MAG: DUF2318 domain-containing protein [Chloroflexi bacterium]|nr:DUF2318 domain-containing protein [Chloroflexota bacterium]
MLKVLISALHSGIEIAFLIALLAVTLRGSGQRGLSLPLKWGTILGAVFGLGLTYGIISGWDREAVELLINALAVVLAIGLIIQLGWTSRDATDKAGSMASWVAPFLILLGVAALVIVPGLDIALTQTRFFLGLDRPTSTELVTKLGAVAMVLAVAALAGITLKKVTARARPRLVTSITMITLFILLIRNAATVVQISLNKGMIPLTRWLFRLIVPVVNNYAAFFYILLIVIAVLALVTILEWRRQRYSLDGLNPAQKRKVKVTERRTAAVFVTIGLLMALVVGTDKAAAFFGSRPPQLSPATPVSAESGQVRIPMDSVADGSLRRFSFATAEGTTVRFLVIYKGSGVYGVGLDACEFCGAAGYRQDKENVICNRCSAAINKTTIGFPGGCNPIPLPYEKEGNVVNISAEELTAKRTVFAQ